MKPMGMPEHRIRIKVGLIFLVVTLFLSGVWIYSYSLKRNIDNQKQEAEQNEMALAQTANLINSIQRAQVITNDYLISPRRKYLKLYDSVSTDIYRQIDVIKKSPFQRERHELLENINVLLNAKNSIVKQLTEQFKSESPLKNLDEKIEAYGGVAEEDPIIVPNITTPTTHSDTTILVKKKGGFWHRFKNLFTNEQGADTTINITTVEKDTLMKHEVDTLMFADLKSTTEEASKTYSIKIQGIERQVQRLILAEQNIAIEISQLLNKLYNGTTEMTQHSIRNSEVLTQRIFTFAIAVGALSLALIVLIIVLIVNDLNKGQKARLALAKEKQLTENLMESRHKLLLSVSHDIKTPLSSIMGYMEMWNMEDIPENKKRQLQSAQNSGQHILSMLANLLEFSRLERNLGELHTSRFDVVDLTEEIIRLFQPLAKAKNLRLDWENCTDKPFFIETDYTVLKQILINVISNAVKYTVRGSVHVKIDYRQSLIFTVSDTGIGMNESDIREIFKPFSRIQNHLKAEGSGFGMYVTKGLIDSLRGTIQIQSEKDRGTSMTIQLPLHKIENTPVENPESNTSHQASIHSKILIFEDDVPLGNMIREFLIQNGFKVKLCSDTRDVKGFINHISLFDIVFTDMQMIHITGTDILHEIRKTASDIPVWLMTACDDYTTEKAIAEGFSGFVKKPIRMSGLIEILSGEKQYNSATAPENGQFSNLTAMFGDDRETIRDILSSFVQTTHKDIDKLNKLIENSDFEAAQQTCHKMHPFLNQIGATHLCGVLLKMDALRGEEESAYPEWKKELAVTIDKIREFADAILQE